MDITKPTLVLDEKRCRQNIARMVKKAEEHGLIIRPHFKTHQSKQIGRWFREYNVSAITVSSIGMANYFAEDGWEEITIAFPTNILRIDELNALAAKITLNLFVDNLATLEALEKNLDHSVNLYIEVDTGNKRSGVAHTDIQTIEKLVHRVKASQKLTLKGCYAHAGHTYLAKDTDELSRITAEAKQRFLQVKSWLNDEKLEFCWGDTPSCSTLESFEGLDAISPGNFVFYDLMQEQIGSCSVDDIAVALYCPVVSKKEEELALCIHGGAIHFSKDSITQDGQVIYGRPCDPNSWQPLAGYVMSLSQEHGLVHVSRDDFDRFTIGDVLAILPVHSCLTAEDMGEYQTREGIQIDHYAQKNRD